MSKSRGNVVTPDHYLAAHGADVLRCALLFAAPWEQGGDFTDDGIVGIERFFARARRTITSRDEPGDDRPAVAKATAAVTDAIERLAFNVGIARLMELLPSTRSATSRRTFVRLLAPFAPHLAEELWYQLGETFSVHTQPWPVADIAVLRASPIEIVVQIDGRRCGTIEVAQRSAQGAIVDLARERITGVPADDHLQRVVFVPDRLLNFVTQPS